MKKIFYFVCIVIGACILWGGAHAFSTPLWDEKPLYENGANSLIFIKHIVYYMIALVTIAIGFLLTKFGIYRLIGKKAEEDAKKEKL